MNAGFRILKTHNQWCTFCHNDPNEHHQESDDDCAQFQGLVTQVDRLVALFGDGKGLLGSLCEGVPAVLGLIGVQST